uniref:NADH-ubiquinone oxidoreductase chain 1 n=1 Tax=Lepidopsocidae sp. RS-2001 TaxID=159971 RepID=Q7YHL4_9NEOP|nr:NADH dehydrogenase subunit 1 [Lepidopsocidae sp. RS-2001]AAP44724.1 NADH dehydrogenase subunit 1 [Lepidopsocidae sp. RS-2001]
MFNELLINFINFILLLIGILVGVAFLTLLERKVLGYIQIRKGPNKLGFIGLLQPFSDAIKLFTKEQVFPNMSNYYPYYFSPVFLFFLSLISWMIMPYFWVLKNLSLGLLFFMVCLSLGVYGIMISGWSSFSLYALLGSLRSVAQTISYEVSLSFILISMLMLIGNYSFMSFYFYQKYLYLYMFGFPLCLMWMVSMLAEVNRTPFDFAEAESELVSGFNIEYGMGGFALIFLAEYSSIFLMSMVFTCFFLGADMLSLFFFFKLLFVSFFFIWVRGSLPRFRYDKLMNLCWKSFLSLSLFILSYHFCFMIYMSIEVL